MELLNLTLRNGKNIEVEKETKLYDIVDKYNLREDIPVVLGNVNGRLYELTSSLKESGEFDVVDTRTKIGRLTYMRTLQFVLIKATLDIFENAKITIEHSLSKGLFGEIYKDTPLNEQDIVKIKERMIEIIEKDIPINKVSVSKEKAYKIFEEYDMKDKLRLLNHVEVEEIKLYELDGRYDYFYGPMAYSTGVLKYFDLMYFNTGFILRLPSQENPKELPKFIEYKKLAKIFYESEQWGRILNVAYLGALNDLVRDNKIEDMIRVNEALHEKKIAYIADKISERDEVKVVLIAGPSSSGKTTFSKRLGIQLRVNGLIPIAISLDDYFVNRADTPKDENGDYDFESIYALDLELFNKNLSDLLEGKEVQTPTYNFKTGEREWNGEKLRIPHNGVVIIEGIHGLNEMLTSSIPKENKFKIYISCLTQLNIDDHNRIPTTDVRTIRRIVRDSLSRGYGAETTLKMWPSIKRGEERNIFVFQEEADVMFNSNLVYELCVLKKYALEELKKIEPSSPVYYEAWRLRSFLHLFKDVDSEMVPDNSIVREFVGGSYFYKY